MMLRTMYKFKLYVNGNSKRTKKQFKELNAHLKQELNEDYSLKVINVREHPQEANGACILATPTIVRTSPEPIRKVFGNLNIKEGLLEGLGFHKK